ncbi:MAG: DoxX family protein [Parachlamydiales bacterium]|nr:DoxX family protein [Parachlamydiales bacterium]
MRAIQCILLFLGRMMISGMFLTSAVHKILNWQEIERGLVSLFCDWHGFVSFSPSLQKLFANVLLPWVPLILVSMTAFELIGGLLIFLKIKVRLGAGLLLIFTLIVSVLFHHFWFLEGPEREIQMVFFIKNLAIMGGLCFILVFGSEIKRESVILPRPEVHMPDRDE